MKGEARGAVAATSKAAAVVAGGGGGGGGAGNPFQSLLNKPKPLASASTAAATGDSGGASKGERVVRACSATLLSVAMVHARLRLLTHA